MRKSMQEGDTQKQTKDLNALFATKKSLDYIWDAQGFPTSTSTRREDNLTVLLSIYICCTYILKNVCLYKDSALCK